MEAVHVLTLAKRSKSLKAVVSSLHSLVKGDVSPSSFAEDKVEYTSLVADIEDCTRSSLDHGSLPKYTPVSLSSRAPSRSPSPKTKTRTWATRLLALFFAVWTLFSGATLLRAWTRVDPQSLSCSCGGTTVAEAKRRGCVYSPLGLAWLPEHCIDWQLANAFDRAGPGPNGEWAYWADRNGTVTLSREEVGALADHGGVYYSTQEWHVSHCVFTWMKHYRSKETGVTIERRSNGIDHIEHCEGIFRMREGLQEVATVAGIALDADDPGETDFEDFS